MTEQPPDIPPWSPLADRAGEDGVAQPGFTAGAAGATGALDLQDPLHSPGTDDEHAAQPAGTATDAAEPTRTHSARWLVGALAAAAVLAIALLMTARGNSPAPAPTTLVRAPLPTTSFDEPAALGTRVALGNGWTVAVRAADTAATPALRQINSRSPLAKGQQYVLIDLAMIYVDGVTDADSPFLGVDLGVVGEDGKLVTPGDSPCTAPAPAFDVVSEISRGGGESGRICFAVDADQVDSLRLVAEPSMTFGSEPSWFALFPDR